MLFIVEAAGIPRIPDVKPENGEAVVCAVCQAEGYIKGVKHPAHATCNNKGVIRCKDCRHEKSASARMNCAGCRGSRWVPCPICRCTTCLGKGTHH